MTKAIHKKHSVQIEGDKELIRKLKSFSKGFKKGDLLYAVMQGAEIIKQDAKANAPVRTGRLRDSIMAEELKSGKKLARVGVGWRIKKGVSGKGKPSRQPAYYGIMVEKGTKSRTRKLKSRKPRIPLKKPASTGTMPQRPFLEPAFRSKRGQAVIEIKKQLSRLIKRATKKGLHSG